MGAARYHDKAWVGWGGHKGYARVGRSGRKDYAGNFRCSGAHDRPWKFCCSISIKLCRADRRHSDSMKKLLVFLALIGASVSALAQSAGIAQQANAGTTGTTLNYLASMNSSNAMVLTSSTTVPAWIVTGNAGTTGTPTLATTGQANCNMDATNASGMSGAFVIANASTGQCHAQTAAPTAGTYVIGFLASASTSSGSNSAVNIDSGFFTGTSIPAADIVAGALANGMTATTQSAGDNSTKLATTAYANTVYNLVQTSGSPYSLAGLTGYYWNDSGSTYTFQLDAPVAGKQYCFGNYSGQTGAITVKSTTSVYIVYKGTNGTVTSGTLVSGGAAGDFVCMEGVDATHYMATGAGYGTWTNN